jgi:hypothetical protein
MHPSVCKRGRDENVKSSGTIFAVCQLPQPWPPDRDVVMMSTVVDSTRVNLITRADGSLVLVIEPEGSTRRAHVFQRIQISGSGKVLIDFSWEDSIASMRVNGQPLVSGDPSQTPALTIETKGELQSRPHRIFPGVDLKAARTDTEALFLATVDDLNQKTIEHDWYTALRAAASLRQLLLDGLLHRANSSHRISFIFRTNEFASEPPGPPYKAQWINLDPTHLSTVKTETLSLDDFLAAKCLVFEGHVATVKDIIKACANAKGGVHFGPPKPGAETVVISFDEICTICGLPASLKALIGLCRITLGAVHPLVLKINAQS